MMGKLRSGIILSLVMGTILAGSLPAQKTDKSAVDIQPPAGWKGRIEIKDGIRTVVNPDQPLFGEFAFDLEKDLVIGDEKDEHKTFYKGAWIQVDDQGCIYALDKDKSCIFKFDPSGNYLMTFGRKGQGPGELDNPEGFYIDTEGRVIVLHISSMGIEVFLPNGSYDKRIQTTERMRDFFMNSSEGLFAKTYRFIDDVKTCDEIVEIDPNGKIFRTLAVVKKNPPMFLKNGSLMGMFTGHHYTEEILFSRIRSNGFCYALSGDYKIMITDSSGRISR